MTPLHAAAFQGRGKILHILLEAGGDVTQLDKYGKSPAFYGSADDAIWPLFASKRSSWFTSYVHCPTPFLLLGILTFRVVL